ncbi:MAG TPA: Smr/MutS family protein [Stellaceae bacterium]|nr:Smr/MutS family protein [Stellaceae bacterium]
MRKRAPSQDERRLWQLAMRDAVPLPGRPALPPAPMSEPARVPAAPPAHRPPVHHPAARAVQPPAPIPLPELTYARAPGLDRRSAERLKRGKLPIEARLDLHGLTQETARRALDRFVADAADRGLRAVLVITGKGLGQYGDPGDPGWTGDERRPGVLRSAVPRWLNEQPNRPRVLAFTQAQDRDGGTGALYVLLRRVRGDARG